MITFSMRPSSSSSLPAIAASVSDLKGRTETDLLAIPGIGEKAVDELRTRLAEYGIALV
jgi:DNA-directed RNA polymerase alpha subunit